MLLVVAYGNPLRGDDAVAWEVATSLSGENDVEVTCVHQLAPELAYAVSRADGVLFLDAAGRGKAGQIDVVEIRPQPETSPLGHVTSPKSVLALSAECFGRAPAALLETISGRDFGFGTDLSPPVAAAVPAACLQARSALARLRNQREQPT